MSETRRAWIPPLSPKQVQVFNMNTRYNLVSGPRWSGKTIGVEHRVLRHLWETPNAVFAIFSKTLKRGLQGAWRDMTRTIIPIWHQSGLTSPHATFEITKQPTADMTRMNYMRVRNYWGGESEIQLHSLDFDDDIYEKLFETRFSGFWFSELQHFHSEAIFQVSIQQLRMPHMKYDDYLWIADTNPPDEGPDHFAYDLWFRQKDRKDHPDPEYQAQFSRIEISLDENPFIDERAKRDLKESYRNDPEAYSRFVEGKWTWTSGHKDKIFSMLFSKDRHVVGNIDSPNKEDWEILIPIPEKQELITGWDLGEVNHAAHIIQSRITSEGLLVFDVLDELVKIDEECTIEEFTEEFMEHMVATQKMCLGGIDWSHWSDTSSFRFRSGNDDLFEALTVARVSKQAIQLEAATTAKAPHTVRKRIREFKKLLRQNRIFVSAHCIHTIEMFKELRKGKKPNEAVLEGQRFKHAFDSLSYAIYSELLLALQTDDEDSPEIGRPSMSTVGVSYA